MNLAPQYRRLLAQAGPGVLKEFEALMTSLAAWSSIEHNDDGSHGDLTTTGLLITPTTVRDAALKVASGLSELGGAFACSNVLTPSQITATQNDYYAIGIESAFLLRLTSDANRTITGIMEGPRLLPYSGRLLLLLNAGTNPITLTHEGTGSTANFRFKLPGSASVVIAPNNCVMLYYDPTSTRWVMLAGTGSNSISANEYNAGNSGTAIAIDWANGAQQIVTMNGNATFTYSNPVAGAEYRLILVEDGTGGYTPNLGASVTIVNAQAAGSRLASQVSIVRMVYTAQGGGRYVAWFDPYVVDLTQGVSGTIDITNVANLTSVPYSSRRKSGGSQSNAPAGSTITNWGALAAGAWGLGAGTSVGQFTNAETGYMVATAATNLLRWSTTGSTFWLDHDPTFEVLFRWGGAPTNCRMSCVLASVVPTNVADQSTIWKGVGMRYNAADSDTGPRIISCNGLAASQTLGTDAALGTAPSGGGGDRWRIRIGVTGGGATFTVYMKQGAGVEVSASTSVPAAAKGVAMLIHLCLYSSTANLQGGWSGVYFESNA